jgi:hypothetical protein
MPTTVETDAPPVAPSPEAEPRVDLAQEEAWFEELRRLREERPYPATFDTDQQADLNWYFEQLSDGALDRYLRRFIAIRNKTVVGDDIDPAWLQLSLARQHPHLNPDCFHISYVD